jgi:H+-transporting ATPase
MLNAFVGWYQEKQAGDIVEQLKAGIAMKAIVCPQFLVIWRFLC